MRREPGTYMAVQDTPLNPYAAGGYFGHYKIMQIKPEKLLKPWHMDTHLRVLKESQ